MIPIDVGSATVVRVTNDEATGTIRPTFWIAHFLTNTTKDCRLTNNSLLNFTCLSFKLRPQKQASSLTLLFKRTLERLTHQDSGSIFEYRKRKKENQIKNSKVPRIQIFKY